MKIERYQTFKWCPGAESNHRHEDFQSNFIHDNSVTYEASPRQTPNEPSDTYGKFVKPKNTNKAKKNPGARTGATEVENCKAGELPHNPIPKRKRLSISKHADLNHKIAGKVICDGLVMGHDFDAWADVMAVLATRLTVPERAMIAWAVLKGLPDDAVAGIIDTVAPVPEPEPAPAHVVEAAIEYRRQAGLSSFTGGRA